MSDRVAWPNIALLDGRLLGLGANQTLPEGLIGFDASGRGRPVGGRHARRVRPCRATSPQDRAWLNRLAAAGHQAVAIRNQMFLIQPPQEWAVGPPVGSTRMKD
jgi:hypothetical protein